jgi:HAD superfamily hydrolase (TIGR01509 family)
MPAVEAVIFDLDGLILDSETPEYLAWQAVYARYGLEFPRAAWLQNVGRNDDPFDVLGPFRRADSPVSPATAAALWRERRDALLQDYLTPLPGVVPLLDGVRRLGLRTAVASSTRLARVRALLRALGLEERFEVLAGGDEVAHGKPAPDVYLLAARRLGVRPEACVALEDSENGVRAATSAGMRCIAVPSSITRGMNFSGADVVAASLVEVTPETIAAFDRHSRPGRR